jgi:Holliday junction resolvase RusA-like endonuclease
MSPVTPVNPSCGRTAIEQDVRFTIQVMPWSAQSAADHVDIRDAVAAELAERDHLQPARRDAALCMTIVSLVPRKTRRQDADNLIKGVADSMQGHLYFNDRQVQCVTSRRVEYACETGLYFVSVRSVWPWDADVVFDDPTEPTIGSGRPARTVPGSPER